MKRDKTSEGLQRELKMGIEREKKRIRRTEKEGRKCALTVRPNLS